MSEVHVDHMLGPREWASRFVFELAYGTIRSPAWSVVARALELKMGNVGRRVSQGSLAKLEGRGQWDFR